MDYAVPGHLIEHVPDVIGWLLDLRGTLKKDGLLSMAIPDRRFTSDRCRSESTAGEMLEAHLLRLQRPPARHLFDQVSLHAALPKLHGWEDEMPVPAAPQDGRLPAAQRLAERVASISEDVDAPCWVFTPESFLDVAERLSRIGFFPFAIEHFQPTKPGDCEFHVGLRTLEDAAAIAASFRSARDLLKSSPAEQAHRETLRAKVHAQMLPELFCGHLLEELEQQKKQLKDEQRRLDNEVRHLQGLMEDFTTSTSWRLTRPLRWLGRVLKSTDLARKLLYDPFRRKG